MLVEHRQNAVEAQGQEAALQVRVYTSWDELADIKTAWQQLLQHNIGPTIFSTVEWLGAWWNAYSHGKQLIALAFLASSGELVGLAPFYLETIPGGIRRLRLVGDGSADSNKLRLVSDGSTDSDNLDLIIRSGQEEICCKALIAWLASEAGWDLCELNTLPLTLPTSVPFCMVSRSRDGFQRRIRARTLQLSFRRAGTPSSSSCRGSMPKELSDAPVGCIGTTLPASSSAWQKKSWPVIWSASLICIRSDGTPTGYQELSPYRNASGFTRISAGHSFDAVGWSSGCWNSTGRLQLPSSPFDTVIRFTSYRKDLILSITQTGWARCCDRTLSVTLSLKVCAGTITWAATRLTSGIGERNRDPIRMLTSLLSRAAGHTCMCACGTARTQPSDGCVRMLLPPTLCFGNYGI
jgi:hypothetical protein